MTKTPLPLQASDMTVFCRALSKQLGPESPSHLSLMNMVARSAGFQNIQHMRSDAAAKRRITDKDKAERDAADLADARSVERCLQQFDLEGRLVQWPSKRAVQTLALWALWAKLPTRRPLSERELSLIFAGEHCFGDPATLRRTMISCGLVTRTTDGSQYWRVEKKPPADAIAILRAVEARRNRRKQPSSDE